VKKVLRVGTIESLQKGSSSNEMFIASRMGDKAWIQNLEVSGAKISYFDGTLTISIPLRDGEFVSMGDQQGVADKRFV
jgi:hypothetical protein